MCHKMRSNFSVFEFRFLQNDFKNLKVVFGFAFKIFYFWVLGFGFHEIYIINLPKVNKRQSYPSQYWDRALGRWWKAWGWGT